MRARVFIHHSIIDAPARDLFEWHEQPEALLELLPSRFVRILRRSGGLRDGGRVVLTVGMWPMRLGWEAVYHGYVKGVQFCDEQVRGPFRMWRHTHRVTALTRWSSVLEDRIEYALPGGRIVEALADGVLRRLLASIFERRHAITRTATARPSALRLAGDRGAMRAGDPSLTTRPTGTLVRAHLRRGAR